MQQFENSVATIQVHKQERAVAVTWMQAPTSAEFRDVLIRGLAMAREHDLTNWLGDVRALGAISIEDQSWSNDEWFPKAIVAGINKMAIVVSDDIFNKLSVDEIMSKVEVVNFTSQYFSSADDALYWLSSN